MTSERNNATASHGLRALVCGGRDYGEQFDRRDRPRDGWEAERWELGRALDDIRPHIIINGACEILGRRRGADRMASCYAQDKGVWLVEVPALWFAHGRAAGPRRNRFMLELSKPDLVVACPGGFGTKDMIETAESAGVPVRRVIPQGARRG